MGIEAPQSRVFLARGFFFGLQVLFPWAGRLEFSLEGADLGSAMIWRKSETFIPGLSQSEVGINLGGLSQSFPQFFFPPPNPQNLGRGWRIPEENWEGAREFLGRSWRISGKGLRIPDGNWGRKPWELLIPIPAVFQGCKLPTLPA